VSRIGSAQCPEVGQGTDAKIGHTGIKDLGDSTGIVVGGLADLLLSNPAQAQVIRKAGSDPYQY